MSLKAMSEHSVRNYCEAKATEYGYPEASENHFVAKYGVLCTQYYMLHLEATVLDREVEDLKARLDKYESR